MGGPEPEVVKWYTRARRFPQLIGRTPDGKRIWGGPYTITQVVTAGVLLFVGVNTAGMWARYGLVGNGVLLLGITYGVVLGLGRVPVGSRSPLAVLAGTVRAVSAPPSGRLAGRAVRPRGPHRVRHRTTVLLDAAPEAIPAGLAAAGVAGTPVAAAATTTGKVSGVASTARVAGGAVGITPSSWWPRTRRRGIAAQLGGPRPAPAVPPPVRAAALSGVQALLAEVAAGPGCGGR
jgi:hypothetical protein